MKNAIVLVANKENLEYTKQVIYSSYKYGNWKEDYVIITTTNVTNKDLKWFKERNIHVIKKPHIIKKPINHYPVIVFHKYYLFHPMMKKWDKIIYLDADVIVRKDINELKKYDDFAATSEFITHNLDHEFHPPHALTKQGKEKYDHLKKKYDLKKHAINTGIMIINTITNSEEKIEKLIKLTKQYSILTKFGEQGIINLLYQDKWTKIPYIYNDVYPTDKYYHKRYNNLRKNDKDAAILHFYSPNKPWIKGNPYYMEWKKNYKEANKLFEVKQIGQKVKYYNIVKTNLAHNILNLNKFIKKIYSCIYDFIEFQIGTTGQYIKKKSPKTYYILKNIMNKVFS